MCFSYPLLLFHPLRAELIADIFGGSSDEDEEFEVSL